MMVTSYLPDTLSPDHCYETSVMWECIALARRADQRLSVRGARLITLQLIEQTGQIELACEELAKRYLLCLMVKAGMSDRQARAHLAAWLSACDDIWGAMCMSHDGALILQPPPSCAPDEPSNGVGQDGTA